MTARNGGSGGLDGKVALVTGAGSGIGYAIAERFAHEGAAVAIDYLGHGEDARALARDLNAAGAKAVALEADVTDAAAVEALVAQIVERFGRLDVLVNNAGIEKSQPLLEIDEASWDRTLAVDLKGPFLCLQAAARRMKESGGGSIVNISSIHEDLPFPSYTPYAAAKGGLRMLMRNAALELAPLGIRVNNIAPGAIATPINAATLADPAKVQRLQEIVPLQRMGTARRGGRGRTFSRLRPLVVRDRLDLLRRRRNRPARGGALSCAGSSSTSTSYRQEWALDSRCAGRHVESSRAGIDPNEEPPND